MLVVLMEDVAMIAEEQLKNAFQAVANV